MLQHQITLVCNCFSHTHREGNLDTTTEGEGTRSQIFASKGSILQHGQCYRPLKVLLQSYFPAAIELSNGKPECCFQLVYCLWMFYSLNSLSVWNSQEINHTSASDIIRKGVGLKYIVIFRFKIV
jgi:hypothetical protein